MNDGRPLDTNLDVGDRLPGLAVGCAGLAFVGTGLWARRDVKRVLAQERIVNPEDARPVEGAAGARAMAELIRRSTIAATGGRTYAETDSYVDEEGKPTSDADGAAKDERTGAPVENPDHALWIQSTSLQTALTQAYMAFRLSELTIALGGAFVAIGVGLAAAGRGRGR